MTTDELMTILAGPPMMKQVTAFGEFPVIRDRVKCADGFAVSVQASEYHYIDAYDLRDNLGGYNKFELGYPSEPEPLIAKYAETPDTHETGYGFVPFDIVRQVIEKHGGPHADCDRRNFGALSRASGGTE